MNPHKLLALLRDNARAEGPAPIRVESTETEAHLYVYDVIDSWYGVGAASLVTALEGAGNKTVHLHINSPGGDVFEARAMAAALVAHSGKVISHIDGLAASAATYLALAGNEVRIAEGSLFMVHNSWTLAFGNKNELLQTADLLAKIDGTIAADYQRKTGASAEQVTAWMDAETWFTAAEALAAKFVDAIDPNSKSTSTSKDQANAQACSHKRWNLTAYANPPADQTAPPATAPDLTELTANQMQANRNRLRLYQI